MKITLVLQKQHLGRMFKYNWLARRHRVVPIDTSIVERLQAQGIEVEDAKNVAYDKVPEPEKVEEIKPCTYTLSDTNVLLEGLEQASVLLRTVIHSDQASMLADLPETFVSKDEEVAIKRCVAYAHLYDAQQVKLPKRVNPERKMWNYPRDYGVSQRRKLNQISSHNFNSLRSLYECCCAKPCNESCHNFVILAPRVTILVTEIVREPLKIEHCGEVHLKEEKFAHRMNVVFTT